MIFWNKTFEFENVSKSEKNGNIFSTMFDMFDDISWMIELARLEVPDTCQTLSRQSCRLHSQFRLLIFEYTGMIV